MNHRSLRGRRYLALLRTSTSQTEPSPTRPTARLQDFIAKGGVEVGHKNVKTDKKQGRES